MKNHISLFAMLLIFIRGIIRSYTFHCLMRIFAVMHVIYLSYTTIRNILIMFHGSFFNTVILTSRLNMLLLSRSQDSHVSLSS